MVDESGPLKKHKEERSKVFRAKRECEISHKATVGHFIDTPPFYQVTLHKLSLLKSSILPACRNHRGLQ